MVKDWLTDKSFPLIPKSLLPQGAKGLQAKAGSSKAPRPLWERGWGEGSSSFVSQSVVKDWRRLLATAPFSRWFFPIYISSFLPELHHYSKASRLSIKESCKKITIS
jgi:hypothetical protein